MDDFQVQNVPQFAPPELWEAIEKAFTNRRNQLTPSAVHPPSLAGMWVERLISQPWVRWEWKVFVVGQRMRALLAQAITERWICFFRYSNEIGNTIEFPVTAALRLAAGQTTSREVIDFCLSPRGLLLRPMAEVVQESLSGPIYIKSKMLTTRQAKDWFSGTKGQMRETVNSIKPWEYDYVFVPLMQPAPSWQHPVRGLIEGVPLCYFIIIAGLSGRVLKRVFWGDPQGERYSHALAEPDPRRPSIHGHQPVLEVEKIVGRILRALANDFPQGFRNRQQDPSMFPTVYLPIESSKCSDGSGIALCMALARIYQQPHEFLRQHVYHMDVATHRVNPVNPNAAEFLLFPESLSGENIAQGTLITLIQAIHAADGVPLVRPQERPATMADFGIPATAKEKDLHDQLFPKNLKWWWNLWIHAEYRSWRDVLYYMVYKERLDMGERRYLASQLSAMFDQTRGMRLAGWQVGR